MASGESGAVRRGMSLAAAAVLGGAVGSWFGVAPPVLTSLFWPKIAQALLLLGPVATGAGALGFALLPDRWRTRLPASFEVPGAGLAAVAALSAVPAAKALAASLLPGSGLGLTSFPLPFLVLLVVPHAIAGAALAAWAGTGDRSRVAFFLLAGALFFLAASLLAGLRAGRVALSGEGDSAIRVSVDRGLREDVIAQAQGAALPFKLDPGKDGTVDVLMAGFPNGPVLAALLADERTRFTVFEEDRELVAAVMRRWPALAQASAAGRLSVLSGSPRWFLERTAARYDVIVLAETWSYAAHLSRALAVRREHRYTVESLRACMDHLEPTGLMLVQRAGIGRVVSTLREAYGVAEPSFARTIVVLGQSGRLVSQCWFRPKGFTDGPSRRQLREHRRIAGAKVLYRPTRRRVVGFYHRLVTGSKVRGLYFSTPLDLSPPRDIRPSFDHMERLILSPSGRALPEELDPGAAAWEFRVLPAADRPLWAVLMIGCAVVATGATVGLWRGQGASAGPDAPSTGRRAALPTALFLGASVALGIEAFAAWVEWLAPSSRVVPVALAAAVSAAGLAAAGTARARGVGGSLAALAAALILFAAAGYRLGPAVAGLGTAASSAAVTVAGAALGLAASLAVKAAGAELERRTPGTAAWAMAGALASGAVVSAASRLLAVQFGYPLLWALAAVATLGALRRRRFLPAPPPTPAT